MKTDKFIKYRYLNRHGRKNMTVCIAAICDNDLASGAYPKIVFCADRLVSAGIQFEGGESKIRGIAPHCYIMQASDDSALSDLVLDNVGEKLRAEDSGKKIKEIATMVADECINLKKETLNREVLAWYNLVKDKLGEKAENISKMAMKAVNEYGYPPFEFLIIGLDSPIEAHIYTVNQNGEMRPCDSIGFATIGGGASMAFLELTKYPYAKGVALVEAIPRVYFAKKVSERTQGVGRWTDLYVMHSTKDKETNKLIPAIGIFSVPEYIDKLNEVHKKVQDFEVNELHLLANDIYGMLSKPKDIGESKEKTSNE